MPTPEEELQRILHDLYLSDKATEVTVITIRVSVWTLRKPKKEK